MIKLLRFLKGKALVLTIIGICCVMIAAYLDAQQPTFLNNAISSINGKYADGAASGPIWWGDNNTWHWTDPTSGTSYWGFYPSVIMMSIYAGCSLISGLTASFLGSAAALYGIRNVRNGMYIKIQTYSFYEVDKLSTGSIVTRLSNDAQMYQMNLQMIFTMAFRTPITIGISIFNAFTPPMGNTTYGIIIVCIVIVMIGSCAAIGLPILPVFTKAQKSLDSTNNIMRENILGARVVKAFNIQEDQHKRYDEKNKQLRILNIKGQARLLPIMSIIQFILNAGIVIILIVAGIQFVNLDTHPPINAGIFAFVQLIAIVLFNTLMLIMVILNTVRTLASTKRINEIFDLQPSIVETKDPTLIPTDDFSVKFDHVNFKYNKQTEEYVLKDINFEVKSGQTLGIVGGTGSGKSTIASLIPRFYDVDEGAITIGGVNIKNTSFDNLNDTASVVLQEAFLFSGTIKSNLLYGNHNATEEDMQHACENACAWDFISETPKKLETEVEQRGRNFSGGQKQRLSLARTLVKRPKILILDDTTSALDLLTEARVQQNLNTNYNDCTKIIISQRISSVKNADKILVLENGEIAGQGTHSELIQTNAIYKQIVQSQLGQEGFE